MVKKMDSCVHPFFHWGHSHGLLLASASVLPIHRSVESLQATKLHYTSFYYILFTAVCLVCNQHHGFYKPNSFQKKKRKRHPRKETMMISFQFVYDCPFFHSNITRSGKCFKKTFEQVTHFGTSKLFVKRIFVIYVRKCPKIGPKKIKKTIYYNYLIR